MHWAKLTSNKVFITDACVFARLPPFSPYSSHPFFSPLCISRETVEAETRLLANIVGTPNNTTVVYHLCLWLKTHVQSTLRSPAGFPTNGCGTFTSATQLWASGIKLRRREHLTFRKLETCYTANVLKHFVHGINTANSVDMTVEHRLN